MGRKPAEMHANAILSRAIYAGLVALVRLARLRVNRKTRKFYASINRMWTEAHYALENEKIDRYDFSPVQDAEANMRGQFLKILWQSTKRFGNRECKRVYSWVEGTVGPLNALLNYAGARLRDLAMTRYPFPEPEFFQVRVYVDSSKKVYRKSISEKLPPDDAIKVYWRAGYRGNRKHPRVLLVHPTLASLDFVDMIRAHLVELCRQCFIHNVPRTEAHRYIRLLIYRFRPFLDYIYTEKKHGRNNFNPNADQELREIVLEIRSLYGKRAGRRKSITKKLADDFPQPTTKLVKSKAEALLNNTNDPDRIELLSQILDYIDKDVVVDRDIEKLKEHVESLSQKEGNEWHRILLSNLHHPMSLKQVVFAGDILLEEPSSVLIVGELPVAKRKGQIDITVFLRREVPGRIIWTPVMILEIKTKTSFDFNLYGIRTGNKHKKDYAPAFYVWKRAISEEEWESIITSDPDKRALDQLDAYETELLQEYKQLAQQDPTPPKSLWKGVVVLDTDQNFLEVFAAFQYLLEDLTMGLINDMIDASNHNSYALDNNDNLVESPKIAAILTPSIGPAELLNEVLLADSVSIENPFSERNPDKRILTTYVSIPSSTSSGKTAAWISKNWHLLNHIQECIETSSNDVDVYWIDLIGDYRFRPLTKRRFGLDALLKQKLIDRNLHTILVKLLDRIKFIDLSYNIEQLLLEENTALDTLAKNVQLSITEKPQTERIIILDGWIEFKELVSYNNQLVRMLESSLLETLPTSATNVIWIDDGASHTKMNVDYQRRCIKPLSHDSPRNAHLDEIIYNIPISPRVFGWQTPRNENVRIIAQDTPTKAHPWKTTIAVPHLHDFARRFRGLSKRDKLVSTGEVFGIAPKSKTMHGRGVTLSNIYADMSYVTNETIAQLEEDALSLIPSIFRPRGDETKIEEESESIKASYQLIPHSISSSDSPTLNSRMTLCPEIPPPTPSRAEDSYVESDGITREWYYDSAPLQFPNEETDEEKPPVRRPPLITTTPSSKIDTEKTRTWEVRRLFYASQFLISQISKKNNLHQCCRKITDVCTKALTESVSETRLLLVLKQVKDIILQDKKRVKIWDAIRPIRKGLIELLNSENREVLTHNLLNNPDLLLLYGNNLFLAVLTALDKVPEDKIITYAVHLWSAIMEWQFYQMGFQAQEGIVKTKYDFQALYTNLKARTSIFPQLSLPEIKPELPQLGELIWVKTDEGMKAWLIFEYKQEMVAGLIQGLSGGWLKPKWYRCVTEPRKKRECAELALNTTERNFIFVTRVKTAKVLWILTGDEEEQQWIALILKHPAPRKGHIQWIKLSEPLLDMYQNLVQQVPAVQSSDVKKRVNTFLKSIITTETEEKRVTCDVSIDPEKEVYVVEFKGDDVQESLEFQKTVDLVKTLRHPIQIGAGLEVKSGRVLMWDHLRDIDYGEVRIKHDNEIECISLSFLKPLVHRSRFFPNEYHVPDTCAELLETRIDDEVCLVIKTSDTSYRSLRVEIKDIPDISILKRLEDVEMNIFDVALLAECEQLVDISTGTRHTVRIDATGLLGLRFSKIEEYRQLKEALDNVDQTKFDWSIGSWRLKYTFEDKWLKWGIYTKKSGDPWGNQLQLFYLNHTLNLQQILDKFKDEVSKIIPLRDISDIESTLENLQDSLRGGGWGDEVPKCRIELSRSFGEYDVIVRSLELGMEIDKLPLELPDEEHGVTIDDYMDHLFSEGVFSRLNIINQDDFYMELLSALSGDDAESQMDEEESDIISTIKEFETKAEEDLSQLVWVCVHTNYLVEYYIRKERFDDARMKVDENITMLEKLDKENKIANREYFVAHVLRGMILVEKGKLKDALKELRYVLEQYPSDVDIKKMEKREVFYFKEAQNLLQEHC
jgi:tetratricopeptide (TPR) repeat protein